MKINIIQSYHRFFVTLLAIIVIHPSVANASKVPFSNFRMSYRDDPQHTAVIGWSGSRNAIMCYDTISHGGNDKKYQKHLGISTSNHYRGQTHNFVRLTGLNSGTRYYFVLLDTISQKTSNEMSFKTLPENAPSLLIVIGGDSRNSLPIFEMSPKKCREGFRNGNILVSKIVPDVVVFGGDFVMNKFFWRRNKEWQQWLSDWQLTITPDGLLIPIIPAVGNHENSEVLIQLFDMPSTNGVYNHFLGGNLISLATLNDMKPVCNQPELNIVDSLMRLNNSTTRWQLVQYHIPMNPQGKRYSKRKDLISCWGSLFKKWGVDIISESHTHMIKTSYPVEIDSKNINNPFSRNDSMGIVFIGEGAWGAPLRPMRSINRNIAYQKSAHGFHILQVNRDSIQISAISFTHIELVTQNPSDRKSLLLPDHLERIPENDEIPLIIKR